MGYASGRVQVENASASVKALWEVTVSTSNMAFHAGASTPPKVPIDFRTSSPDAWAATVRDHDRTTGRLTFKLSDTPPATLPGGGPRADKSPNYAETIRGPSEVSLDSGAATNGGSTYLRDTGKSWTDDQWNGKWVVVRAGTATEEWTRISDTVASTQRIDFETTLSTGVTTSDSYDIVDELEVTLTGYRAGTPQDWVTAGINAGDIFAPDGGLLSEKIATVAAEELTLASNWVGADDYDTSYGVGSDLSARNSLSRDFRRTANRAAMLSRLVDQLDDLIWSPTAAEPNYPEATFGANALGTIGAHGPNTFSGFEILAGSSGVWAVFYQDVDAQMFMLDARPVYWVADSILPDADTTVNGFNGAWGADVSVDSGHITTAAPNSGFPGVKIENTVSGNDPRNAALWKWIPPGKYLYVVQLVADTAMDSEGFWFRRPM